MYLLSPVLPEAKDPGADSAQTPDDLHTARRCPARLRRPRTPCGRRPAGGKIESAGANGDHACASAYPRTSRLPQALVRLRDQLQHAADDGFASAWVSNIFGLDALTALAVAGSQVPGIELGTAVVPTYPRHPAVLAQQALTTATALDGRLTLGIGLSHKIVIEDMYGYSFDRPARHMREYLVDPAAAARRGAGGVRRRDHAGRDRADHAAPGPGAGAAGRAGTADAAAGRAAHRRDRAVDDRAGHGPRLHRPRRSGRRREAAGRPSPRVVCLLPVCVTDDPDGARARANRVFAIYGQLPSYRAMLDREGAAGARRRRADRRRERRRPGRSAGWRKPG